MYQATGAEGNDFRAKAYSDTLRENNIEVNPDFFSIHTQSESSILEDVFFMMTSYKADQRPTALVASDDHIAAQVLRYVKKLNLSVPDDVAIVGWGNIASSQITTPELTTVDTEIPYFAYEVSEALIQMAQGIKVESKLYKGRLIIRGST